MISSLTFRCLKETLEPVGKCGLKLVVYFVLSASAKLNWVFCNWVSLSEPNCSLKCYEKNDSALIDTVADLDITTYLDVTYRTSTIKLLNTSSSLNHDKLAKSRQEWWWWLFIHWNQISFRSLRSLNHDNDQQLVTSSASMAHTIII